MNRSVKIGTFIEDLEEESSEFCIGIVIDEVENGYGIEYDEYEILWFGLTSPHRVIKSNLNLFLDEGIWRILE